MKIVIAGPPHSGKSVFLGGLCDNLPRDARYLFRACPDGEGTWTWKDEKSSRFRRKGQFTRQQVDWYCEKLRKNNMSPIVLVDIGGRTSDENRRILVEGEVDAAIILAGDLQAVPEWVEFMEECGVEIIATIHSEYNGDTDNDVAPVMSVHHLERGEDVSARPTIQKVAEKILSLVSAEPERAAMAKENTMIKEITISKLAEEIGKGEVERTLPSGKIVSQVCWEGADLVNIARLLHAQEKGAVVRIDGAAPAWLVTALVHECHPSAVQVNSPDGFIDIGCQKPGEKSGENLEWKVEDGDDGWIIVTVQQLDPSVPLDPEDMGTWAPPTLPMGSKIILSGRMPNWGMASIAMSYHGTAKAVALFQPGTGSTVAWTHSKEVPLGSVIL